MDTSTIGRSFKVPPLQAKVGFTTALFLTECFLGLDSVQGVSGERKRVLSVVGSFKEEASGKT